MSSLSFLTHAVPINTLKILIGIETKQKGNFYYLFKRDYESFIACYFTRNSFMNYVYSLACIGLFDC